MRTEKIFLCVLSGMFFIISACGNDAEKSSYSGVSELISDRNKARYDIAENPPKKSLKPAAETKGEAGPSDSKKEDLAAIILYEEKIHIVGADSGRTMAKGVAYVNKKGQIVRIKITKE
jgi:hypothetical protein